ncbi:uncharacterized protein isoform X2 [Rhodnius prolixus]
MKIPIVAYLEPPCLKSRCYLKMQPEALTSAMIMQSNVFDCGEILTGSKNIFFTQLYNVGGVATFYLISDLQWIRKKYLSWNIHGEVETPPFKISPAKFAVEKDQKIILKIKFRPKLDGVFVETYRIICNNMTSRSFLVIGDAVAFDPCKIKLLNTASSYLSADIIEDPTCKQFVHLGVTCPERTVVRTISIRNASRINYTYKWQSGNIHLEEIQVYEGNLFKNFPEDSISVKCDFHMLLARYDSIFTIVVNFTDPSIRPGTYRCKLRLIIDCLPAECLTEECLEKFVTHENDNGSFSLELFDIEVWIQVEIPFVEFNKYFIYFWNTSFKRKRATILATNPHNYEINVEWCQPIKCSHNVIAYVEPRKFKLAAGKSQEILIFIDPLQEGQFSENIEFIVNDIITYNVLVEGEIVVPDLDVKHYFNDFGVISFKNDLTVSFPVRHADAERSNLYSREIILLTLDDDKEYYWITNEQIVDCFVENNYRFVTNVKYKCVTDIQGIYASLLEFRRNNKSTYLAILYDVQKPFLIMSPLICTLRKPLYVTVQHETEVSLTNAYDVAGEFTWMPDPIGEDANILDVAAEPDSGNVFAKMATKVRIIMMPMEKGPIRDFKMPLYLPNSNEYLYFSIKGEVIGLSVRIYWEGSDQKYSMTWPTGTDPGDNAERKGYCCPSFPTSTSGLTAADEESKLELEGEQENKTMTFVDSTVSLYSDWPLVGGKYYYDRKDKIETFNLEYGQPNYCEYEGVICRDNKYAAELIEWHNRRAITFELEDRKPMKKIVTVRNLTPMSVTARMCIKTFRGRWVNLELIERKLKNRKEALQGWIWEHNLKKGEHLVLSLVCRKMKLLPNDHINIEIMAYSNLWGVYSDELAIFLPDLPAFTIPIIAIVRQMPIQFTFAPEIRCPMLRFSSVSPHQTCTQCVYAQNTSPVPLKVIWRMYGPPQNPEGKTNFYVQQTWKPFYVEVDLFSENPDNFCNVELIDYFGEIETPYFEIYPALMLLGPNEKQKLSITLKPGEWIFDNYKYRSALYGRLRGVIHSFEPIKPPSAPIISSFRSDGYDYDPVELILSTYVQIPLVRAIINPSDFDFEVHLVDILERPQFGFREVRNVVLKNVSDSTSRFLFHIEKPFHILQLDHLNKAQVHQYPNFIAVLEPEESVEVTFELKLLPKDIKGDFVQFKWNPQSTTYIVFDEERLFREHKLIIKQERCVDQILTLRLKVIPPLFEVPFARLDFGPVYLKDVKTQQIPLESVNRDELVDFMLSPDNGIFQITSKKMLLKKKQPTDVSVSFIPKEPGEFVCTLFIQSCYPMYYKNITMNGIGIWNYKYHSTE